MINKCVPNVEAENICDENNNEDTGQDDPNNTAKFCQILRYDTLGDNKI